MDTPCGYYAIRDNMATLAVGESCTLPLASMTPEYFREAVTYIGDREGKRFRTNALKQDDSYRVITRTA